MKVKNGQGQCVVMSATISLEIEQKATNLDVHIMQERFNKLRELVASCWNNPYHQGTPMELQIYENKYSEFLISDVW